MLPPLNTTPPTFLTAAPWSCGAALLGDLSEGGYQGRRLTSRSVDLAFAPSERLAFWLGESESTAFGRSSDSRFRMHADRQAVRFRLGSSLAIQGERIGTTNGDVTNGDSAAVFRGTRLYTGRLIATQGRFDAALGVGRIATRADDASALSLSFGTRQPLARNVSLWAQGTVVGQFRGDSANARLALRGQVRYAPVPWGAVTLEGTLFPNGLPFDEALGSFLLYDPSGTAASGLRHNAVGYGTLRLIFGGRF